MLTSPSPLPFFPTPGPMQYLGRRHSIASPTLALLLVLTFSGEFACGQESVDFAQQVRPILSNACFQCHGPDAQSRQAGLRLDLAESAASATELNGEGQSVLLERLTTDDPELRMPPAESLHQLDNEQRQMLLEWARAGATYERHWAFVPPQVHAVPTPVFPGWGNNPIDAFVAHRMQEQGLHPASPSSPLTLLRRISFDLVGLPPTPQLRESFEIRLNENGRDLAIIWAIERLMGSRSYGEHMALPWLEAARYADTDGYQNDRYRYQHAWRDWVIRAFNAKMPYDQFVREQLAGDMLPEPTLWQQVASGFGRNHRINSEDGSIPEEWRVENVVDRVDTFGTVFLGLTVGCARCHDHKYDPISQKEYYQLFAYFNNIAEHGVGPNNGNSPPFIELPRTWPLLAESEDHALTPEPVKLHAAREGNDGNGLKRPQAGSPKTVMVMHELAEPRETYLLKRGRYNQPETSEPLLPQVPAALHSLDSSMPNNRLELANWLMSDSHPLTARVAVNRLWQQFFGVGLVPTSDNLGSQGALPSHPELLDWLALELVRSGWDMQHVQRLIVSSATYQQSSVQSPKAAELDPANRWLSRGPRLRLSAFALRDQALAVSGLLVEQTGGESVKPYMPEKIWAAFSNNKYNQDTGEKLFRRSLYTYWRRTIPPPTMMNFNAAAREVCSVNTERTNTPLQSLTLLNNKTFIEAARALAQRCMHDSSQDLRTRLGYLVELSLARPASDDELDSLTRAYEDFVLEFRNEPESAQALLSIGESPRNKTLDAERHAAMTLVASLVLNLDELITKE